LPAIFRASHRRKLVVMAVTENASKLGTSFSRRIARTAEQNRGKTVATGWQNSLLLPPTGSAVHFSESDGEELTGNGGPKKTMKTKIKSNAERARGQNLQDPVTTGGHESDNDWENTPEDECQPKRPLSHLFIEGPERRDKLEVWLNKEELAWLAEYVRKNKLPHRTTLPPQSP